MMAARFQIEWGETVLPAPTPNNARFASKAVSQYPVTKIGSTDYVAHVIAARCRLSPAIARRVVELVGMEAGV